WGYKRCVLSQKRVTYGVRTSNTPRYLLPRPFDCILPQTSLLSKVLRGQLRNRALKTGVLLRPVAGFSTALRDGYPHRALLRYLRSEPRSGPPFSHCSGQFLGSHSVLLLRSLLYYLSSQSLSKCLIAEILDVVVLRSEEHTSELHSRENL